MNRRILPIFPALATGSLLSMLVLFTTPDEVHAGFKLVDGARVIDSNGTNMGIALDYHFPAGNVTVHIGLIIDGKHFTPGVRSVGFTAPGDAMVVYESADCSGQPYVWTDLIERLYSDSMLDTIPIIASNDPINDPANETLWEPDPDAQPSMKAINSFWDTAPADELTDLPIPAACESNSFGQLEVIPVVEVSNLSSRFTPPYSLRLIRARRR